MTGITPAMTKLRSLILALALSAGIAPAFAQAPPPVPALPDTERRTSYVISGTTCACAVGFQLYQDSTDVANWVKVYINGIEIAQSGNWNITSPSGSIATLPRPISDAVLTFTTARTGTVQIVGAQRPRRLSEYAENRGVAARDLNQAINGIEAQLREMWDRQFRTVQAPPGETLALLPQQSARANTGACFDAAGNLVSCVSVPSTTLIAGNGILLSGVSPTTITNNINANAPITISGTSLLTIACPTCAIISGSPVAGQFAVWASPTAIQGIPRVGPSICDIVSTAATTCNNGGSAANNGTYTTPSGALYLRARMVGGGGGGGGSGTAPGAAGTGGNSCFNTSGAGCTSPIYQASGGVGGSGSTVAGNVGGSGGTLAGSATCAVAVIGTQGQDTIVNSGGRNGGGDGGDAPFFSGRGGKGTNANGLTAVPNTGSGGGGASIVSTSVAGASGGGSGAYCEFWVSNPAATYSYEIGAGGSGGTAGVSGNAGGAGSNGRMIFEAYFN